MSTPLRLVIDNLTKTYPNGVRAVLPQEFGLSPHLSAEVTLDHFATLKGVVDSAVRRDRGSIRTMS
ncbi:MAG: hypothetical protein JNJ98_17055 [Gemmatimonadetes bacterium]|nr:hypothetical protein [Gemmatimonadota bacterium]